MGSCDYSGFDRYELAKCSKTECKSVTERAKQIRRRLLMWARANNRDYTWREPGRSPYEVLVAELLLKRTTASAAARVYPDFLAKYPSFAVLNSTDVKVIEEDLKSIGLHRQRAASFKRLAAVVCDEFQGDVPGDPALLGLLPGVGEYTSRALQSFAFDRPAAIVDSNVTRVLHRLFESQISGFGSKDTQHMADHLLPPRKHRAYNLGLLDLGAAVCRYARPRCDQCPLRSYCDYYKKGETS